MRPPTRLDFFFSNDPEVSIANLARAELLTPAALAQRAELVADLREALRQVRVKEQDAPGDVSPVGRLVGSFFRPYLNETGLALSLSLHHVVPRDDMAPPPTRLHAHVRDTPEATYDSLRACDLLSNEALGAALPVLEAMRATLSEAGGADPFMRRCALELTVAPFLNARGRALAAVPIPDPETNPYAPFLDGVPREVVSLVMASFPTRLGPYLSEEPEKLVDRLEAEGLLSTRGRRDELIRNLQRLLAVEHSNTSGALPPHALGRLVLPLYPHLSAEGRRLACEHDSPPAPTAPARPDMPPGPPSLASLSTEELARQQRALDTFLVHCAVQGADAPQPVLDEMEEIMAELARRRGA